MNCLLLRLVAVIQGDLYNCKDGFVTHLFFSTESVPSKNKTKPEKKQQQTKQLHQKYMMPVFKILNSAVLTYTKIVQSLNDLFDQKPSKQLFSSTKELDHCFFIWSSIHYQTRVFLEPA